MQLSRQADYAIRSVLFLATSPLSNIKEIARAQFIPPEYLAKIMQGLVKAGLVNTHRGVHGGVSLTRPPDQITILDVIEAVEGPMAINWCLAEGNECPREYRCAVHDELQQLQNLAAARFAKLNFAMLARKEAAIVRNNSKKAAS